jgi:erythronate-4-phosphate dehydrogenase
MTEALNIVADKNTPFVETAFRHLGKVIPLSTSEITNEGVKEADVLLVRSETKVDRGLLEGSRVQFVGTFTIGTDHVDLEYLKQKSIAFANAPGSNSNAVAEYVVAAVLVIAQRKNFEVQGKMIGVIGVGNVGTKVVAFAEAAGMRVLQNDPPLARMTGDPKFLPLDELMEADIITLHVPLTRKGDDATYHFFDDKRLSKLEFGGILINTSRGAVVESLALKRALAKGHLGAAILDVWENEPCIDSDLLSMVSIGTPHIAGHSLDGKINALRMVHMALCDFFSGPKDDRLDLLLPRPPHEKAILSDSSLTGEEMLRQVVCQSYDIEYDDHLLRPMISIPKEEHGQYFRRLRTEYHVRREFFNTTVEIPKSLGKFGETLKAFGFKVTIH